MPLPSPCNYIYDDVPPTCSEAWEAPLSTTCTASTSENPHPDGHFVTPAPDTEIRLYYYGRRFYNPSHGRWMSRDPIGERASRGLYGFVNNGPMDRVDPVGLQSGMYHGYDFISGKFYTDYLPPPTDDPVGIQFNPTCYPQGVKWASYYDEFGNANGATHAELNMEVEARALPNDCGCVFELKNLSVSPTITFNPLKDETVKNWTDAHEKAHVAIAKATSAKLGKAWSAKRLVKYPNDKVDDHFCAKKRDRLITMLQAEWYDALNRHNTLDSAWWSPSQFWNGYNSYQVPSLPFGAPVTTWITIAQLEALGEATVKKIESGYKPHDWLNP